MTFKRKWLKAVLWTAVGLFGLFVLLMVGVQVVLSPKVCTSLIQKYYPEFIDGKLSLKEASVSAFSHFPAVTLNIDDFLVTYPTRFAGDSTDRSKVTSFLELAGVCRHVADSAAPRMDTLAYFKKLSVSVNVIAVLSGRIRIKNLEFTRPTAYIHVYEDGTSNLDIIKLPAMEESGTDTSSFVIKQLLVKKMFIGSRSNIVYTDKRSDFYSLLHLQGLDFKGRLTATDPLKDNFDLDVDTLFVTGSYNSDTLLFSLDHLGIENQDSKTDIEARADIFVATRALGRVKLPLGASGSLRIYDVDHGTWGASLENFSVDFASIHADAALQATIADTIALKGFVELPSVNVQTVLDRLSEKLVPDLAVVLTDATVHARADVDGYYVHGMKGLPAMNVSLDVPLSHAGIVGADFAPELELHASASAEQSGSVDASVTTCSVNAPGVSLDVKGTVHDLLGNDPKVDVNMTASASVKTFMDKFGKVLGMTGTGELDAMAKGSFNFSNLNLYNLGGIELSSKIDLHGLDLKSFDDSLKLYCSNLSVLMGKQDLRRAKDKVFGVKAELDSVFFLSKGTAKIHGRGIEAKAVASPRIIEAAEYMAYCPLRVSLNMDRFFLQDADSSSLKIRSTKNVANIRPSKEHITLPIIKLTSSNKKIRVNLGPHRFSFTDLAFDASAKMVDNDGRKRRMEAFRDSLLKRHPDWNQDSLIVNFRKKARNRQLPEWMKEEDFRKEDISFNLSSTTKKLFETWDFNGNIELDRARIFTPAFPLKTSLTDFKGGFDNDKVSLDTLRILSGSSDLEASGKVTGLRRALTGKGIPKVRIDICSDTIAFSELLAALAKGQANMEKDLSKLSAMSDEKYDSYVDNQQQKGFSETDPKLIVVPANIDAELKIRGHNMKYSSLDINSFTADILMKKRCLQAKNITAKSNAGNVNIEAFYSTLTKEKLTTGFDLTLSDISASQIISLIPDIDSLVPLVKSFDGLLNCNIAATSSLDTNMNIIMPSLNGVVRITGNNLRFVDSKDFKKLLGGLAFLMPKKAKIDSMKVEGLLQDNQFEIFPFILKMDMWTVSLAGIQHLDKKFSYHASLIKSPLIFKMGANVYGDDFDHVNFKIGKPRFKKEKSIPSFSASIDTTRVNLLHTIRNVFDKRVEQAVRENNAQLELKQARQEQNYTHSASLDALEELSAGEKAFADSLSICTP